MKLNKNIKLVLTGLGALAVIVLILSRNLPTMEKSVETPANQSMAKEFTTPTKENVTPSFNDHIEMLKKSVKANPSNAFHLVTLAQLLMDGHQTAEAITYFEQARKIQPKNDSLLLDLSVCYFSEKNYAKALEITEKILLIHPDHSRALYNKGAIFATQGKKHEAAVVWRRLMKVAPQSEEAKKVKDFLAQLEQQQ
ncbi:MAG: tetratricopeptide repeat protein [Bacteroidota bacterium]|nr:tetratricopeptide repeat protein [Bacteroidota bacterium]